MRRGAVTIVFAALPLAGCAAAPPIATAEPFPPTYTELPRPCGAILGARVGRPGEPSPSHGDLVRPCAPIDARAIELACEAVDGEVVHDLDHAYNEGYEEFVWTELAVTDAACTPQNPDGSRTSCNFTVEAEDAVHRVEQRDFTHIYYVDIDPLTLRHMAFWTTDKSCLAPGA